MRMPSFLCVLAVLLLSTAPLHAQQPQGPSLIRELSYHASRFGLSRPVSMRTGVLEQEDSRAFDLQLTAGIEYAILGVCDDRCSDVDVALYDGNLVVEIDVEADDYPLIRFKPRVSGIYRVVVTVASCDASACHFGLAVYELSSWE